MNKPHFVAANPLRITQPYSSKHKGIDIAPDNGGIVFAHSAGVVVDVVKNQKNNKGSSGMASYGNYVKLYHGYDGRHHYYTLYAHLGTVYVKRGEFVDQSQSLGIMGNTGNSYGTHLHFEVRRNNTRIDPTTFLNAPIIPVIAYRVYALGKWWPYVVGYGNGTDGYAGIKNAHIFGIDLRTYDIDVRVNYTTVNGETYNLPLFLTKNPIDTLTMTTENGTINYRVSAVGRNSYYQWCKNATDPTGDGYAGVHGKPIDLVQIYAGG